MSEARRQASPGRSRRLAGGHEAANRRLRALAAVARIAGPPAALAVAITVGLAVFLTRPDGSRSLAINVWLLTIGGLVMWTCLRLLALAVPAAADSAFDSARVRTTDSPSKLSGVIAIEGVILDAEWNTGGVQYRLRPLLRRIAAARLMERRQVDLETDPAEARRILGDELWALVGPEAVDPTALGSPSPTRNNKGRRGIPRATIKRAIEALEAL